MKKQMLALWLYHFYSSVVLYINYDSNDCYSEQSELHKTILNMHIKKGSQS